VTVSSDNPTGADNQQERPGAEEWTVGFVDGEGCFSISVVRNAGCLSGWQIQHEFSVTQAASSKSALELLIEVFGCGRIIENHRTDNHREPLLRFSVKRRSELMVKVIPFFEERPLRTAKRLDFERFATVVRFMHDGRHLANEGLRFIASITEQMNRRARSRFLESSEAIRQPAHADRESKIWSEPHGDMGNNSSEIPCRVSSDLHEWRNDFPTVSATDPAKLKYE
jgi:LAGLIDADG endonuclease